MDQKVNDKFSEWAELTHRSNELDYAKVYRGEKHNYLGITLDYLTRGAFKVDMTDCVDTMEEDFPYKPNKPLKAWNNKLFSVNANSFRLDKEKSGVFHAFTIKCMFLHKRGQPNVEPRVGFLST